MPHVSPSSRRPVSVAPAVPARLTSSEMFTRATFFGEGLSHPADKIRMSRSRSLCAHVSLLLTTVFVLAFGLTATAAAQTVFRFPGTTPVATPAASQTVTVAITHAGALDSINIRTVGSESYDFHNAGGGTCVTGISYSAGQQCTVNLGITPNAPGERRGAITLLTSAGATIGQQWVSAMATGPLGVFIPGTIDTVAGNNTWIYAGDGGIANQSSIFLPFGVAVDAAGDMFIADSSNDRIRKVQGGSQIISTIAGNGILGATGDGGPALQATISNPTSITVDPAGNVFFADNGNNAIRRIDAFTGIITTVAGKLATHGYTGDGGPATAATLNGPNGISLDAAGNLYIADTANNVVRMVSASTGIISTVAGTGVAAFTGEGGPAVSATLNTPWGVTVSSTGLLYIADQGNNRIRLVDASGKITTILGNGVIGYTGDNGPASAATVNVPAGVAVDVAGNIYVADSGNNVIRKINASTNVITTIAGDGTESISGDKGPATAGGLYGPYSITFDSYGSLYVADVFHNRIREIYASSATLEYKPIREGRVSAPLPQTLENDGNAPLNVSTITPVSSSQVDAATTTCSASTPLGILAQCVIGADFAPTAVGNPVVGTMTVASDSANTPGTIYLVGQVLDVDPASITLTSSSNPSITGSTVVFTVAVSSVGTTPTGSVSLLDGTNTLATGSLGPGGSVTFNVSTLTAGTHNMTASYVGDSNNAAGVSAVLVQTVKDQVAPTTTTLATSTNPVIAGATVTFTAQVQPSTQGNGNGAVTGSVVFKYGTTQLGSANIVNGNAFLNVTSLPVGADSVIATYTGSNSYGTSSSAPLIENVTIATSKTALSSSLNPSAANGPVTLTATVTSNGGIPSGTVTFFDGPTNLGTGTLTNQGLASLTVPGPVWTVGTHTLTASYAGDASDTASISPSYSQLVTLATSKIQLQSTLNPAALGAPITFGATLSSNGGIPTGNVTFYDGATALATVALDPRGYTSINSATLTLGSHNITASYAGDANDTTITSTVLVQVIQPATIAAALASSANPSTYGTVLSLTATITGNGSTPTGSVTFTDGTTNLGVVQLTPAGTAVLTSSNLSIGSHSITASYSGDTNHAAVASNTLTQLIVQPTTTTLTSSNLNPIAGTQVTWTAVVTGANGSPTTGNVTILDGKTVIATLTPGPNGVAAYTSASLPPGTHMVSAAFAGDTLDAASSSAPLTQVVTIATTASTVVSSANPSFAGAPVTFTSTVSGNGSTPTGNVAFMDGAAVITTVPLSSTGTVAFTTSNLAPGIHKITASYLGDTDDAASLSAPVAQQIAQKTSVSLVSSANPSLLTDAVTFSTIVSNGIAGAVPTGQVTLSDGGSAIATATLDATGSATFNVPSPALGTHTMIVMYSGDDQNVPATSTTLIQIVKLRPSTTSLSVSSTAISTGQQLILISVVKGSGPSLPGGTVTFSSGSTVLGSATITDAGVATVTALPLQGQYNVTATYSGDALYATSVSPTIAVTVGPPVEFMLSLQPPTVSMASGDHGQMTINVASAPTFHDMVAFGCAGLPASATCTFSQTKMQIGGNVPASLTVIVDTGNPLGVGPVAHNNTLQSRGGAGVLACFLPAGALLLCLGRRKYRKPLGLLMAVLMLTGIGALTGCGSTFNTTDTPAGSYTFQIVGTGQTTGATQSATVTLTVTK